MNIEFTNVESVRFMNTTDGWFRIIVSIDGQRFVADRGSFGECIESLNNLIKNNANVQTI